MKKEIQYVAGVNYDVAGLNTLVEYGTAALQDIRTTVSRNEL